MAFNEGTKMRMLVGTYRGGCTIIAITATFIAVLALRQSNAQEQHASGQSIAPAYEGFIENSDGTFESMSP